MSTRHLGVVIRVGGCRTARCSRTCSPASSSASPAQPRSTAGTRVPDDALWRARPETVRIGDCVAPRTLAEAIREGRAAALATRPASTATATSVGRPHGVTANFPRLFDPLRIGPAHTDEPHRLLRAPDELRNRRPADPQHAAYYAARAKGGAGLIITEEHTTHPTDRPYEKLIRGYDRASIPGYRAHHRRGTPATACRFSPSSTTTAARGPACTRGCRCGRPAPIADPMFREVPKAIDEREIAEVVDGYALRRRALPRRRLRRRGVAVLAIVDHAGHSCRPPRTGAPTIRRERGEPRPAAARCAWPRCGRRWGRSRALGVGCAGTK